MKIEVYENGSKSKLIAILIDDNGNKRELVRTERGRDDLLNKIDDMNLSFLTVTFLAEELPPTMTISQNITKEQLRRAYDAE